MYTEKNGFSQYVSEKGHVFYSTFTKVLKKYFKMKNAGFSTFKKCC